MMAIFNKKSFGLGGKKNKIPLWLVAAVSLAALVAFLFYFRAGAEGLLWGVLKPIVEWRNYHMDTEAGLLRAKLAATEALVADRNYLYEENLELKKRLGREVSASVVIAGVLQGPPYTPYDTLVLDAGSLDGVAEGNIVSAGGTALIGKIYAVFAFTSRAVLFSSPGEKHEGFFVTGGASFPILAEGQGGGSMVAKIPSGISVRDGSSVVLPGIFGGITGKVSSVHNKGSESFSDVYFNLPASPESLRYVEIWTDVSKASP
jgi:cell shape-determining protein MreC